MSNELSQDYLKSILNYDPDTGIWCWLVDKAYRSKAGSRAGALSGPRREGCSYYRRININGKLYLEHRLAFLYMVGFIPKEIDHKDWDGLNNRWLNLRESTGSQNKSNTGKRKNNKSGFKGVCWSKVTAKWVAQIQFQGKKIHLGYFDSPEEAYKVYIEKTKELNGDFSGS